MASKGRSRTRAPAVWLQSPCFQTHTVSARPSPRSLERHESPCQSKTELASMTPHHPVHPTVPKREQAPSPATHAASASPSTRIRATCSRPHGPLRPLQGPAGVVPRRRPLPHPPNPDLLSPTPNVPRSSRLGESSSRSSWGARRMGLCSQAPGEGYLTTARHGHDERRKCVR